MTIAEESLFPLWEFLADKCSEEVTIDTFLSAYRLRSGFVHKNDTSDLVGLFTICLLEKIRQQPEGWELTSQEIFRAADQAKYQLRKSVKSLGVNIEDQPISTADDRKREMEEYIRENLSGEDLIIFELMLDSKTTGEIAAALDRSTRTAQMRKASIIRRLATLYHSG